MDWGAALQGAQPYLENLINAFRDPMDLQAESMGITREELERQKKEAREIEELRHTQLQQSIDSQNAERGRMEQATIQKDSENFGRVTPVGTSVFGAIASQSGNVPSRISSTDFKMGQTDEDRKNRYLNMEEARLASQENKDSSLLGMDGGFKLANSLDGAGLADVQQWASMSSSAALADAEQKGYRLKREAAAQDNQDPFRDQIMKRLTGVYKIDANLVTPGVLARIEREGDISSEVLSSLQEAQKELETGAAESGQYPQTVPLDPATGAPGYPQFDIPPQEQSGVPYGDGAEAASRIGSMMDAQDPDTPATQVGKTPGTAALVQQSLEKDGQRMEETYKMIRGKGYDDAFVQREFPEVWAYIQERNRIEEAEQGAQ